MREGALYSSALGVLWFTTCKSEKFSIEYFLQFLNTTNIAQKIKFSMKNFFSKWDQIRKKIADLVTFTEDMLKGKLHFFCSGTSVFM